MSLERAAAVADGGIHGAINELVKSKPGPLWTGASTARCRCLYSVPHERGPGQLFKCVANEMEGGRARLFFRTVDIAFKMIGTLEVVVTESAATPGRSLLEQFLLLAYQPVGGCLEYFVIMAIRTIRRLVYGAFYVFSLSLAALPSVRASGMRAKQACFHVLESLGSTAKAAPKTRSAVILRALLQKSRDVDADPCQRITQIFKLVFFLFPTSSSDFA